ncbi:MAG: RNA polymerase sigma-54 factor [Rhizobiales bacterium 65-79]|jgi:RNA polymerase sigma-54 factor|nr:RNA polymerase factor sigma-54 [Hyphomicrobiales bacterium]OJU05636.1 MAG: RNA polymerase sigma-54 factor [Rhizobiales bacterium 65-79]
MGLSARLQLRQSQSLVMTPQLMQSIRLLQLSHAELEAFIDQEIERNPLVERGEDASGAAAGDTPDGADAEPPPESGPEPEWTAASISDRLDASLENVFPDDPGVRERIGPDLAAQWKSAHGGSGTFDGDGFDLEEVVSAPVTLNDHLREQIAFAFTDPVKRAVAAELAGSLDESGYLRTELPEIAARLGIEEETVAETLSTCQGFDPPGIFARDLAECLALQLHARDRLDPAMAALLRNLELLARRDFQALSRLCGVGQEDLLDMLAEIRALDPKPGMAFAGGTADVVVPDVLVRPAPDGSWQVELNPDTLPRVLVDNAYYAQVSSAAKDGAEKDFLAECLQNATWLKRSLDQRAKTILKVASEIVRQQDAFLVHGVRHLRPLNMKSIAEAIGMHESTVSRVSANKYMLTPRGVFELRYFFTPAIAGAGSAEAHSSEAVRDRIRQLIEQEEPADVLSDDSIVDKLRENGVDIARRTVAKYREGMNIPSSVERRREKRALAALG